MRACNRCSAQLESYDPGTNRWFEQNGRPHLCERIARYTDQDQKGKLGFFVELREDIKAHNISTFESKHHLRPLSVRAERSADGMWLIVRP